MTVEYFIQLQKSIYTSAMTAEWQDLFDKYNKKKGTSLTPNLQMDYMIILQSIAIKMGFNFSQSKCVQMAQEARKELTDKAKYGIQ